MWCLVALVVRNVWCGMEELVDSMTTICLIDRASIFFRLCFNDGSEVSEESAIK